MDRADIKINRVVIDEHGTSVPLGRAVDDYDVFPDVLFLRDDYWILGAPQKFERVAFQMWRDNWIKYVRRPSTKWKLIEEYPD